jgi:hypothetical protein
MMEIIIPSVPARLTDGLVRKGKDFSTWLRR